MNGTPSLRDDRHVDKLFYVAHQGNFYEPFYDHYKPGMELLSLVKQLLATDDNNWRIERSSIWYGARRVGKNTAPLQNQGWKIHISATPINCQEVLDIAVRILIKYRVAFKFSLDINIVQMINSKSWSRGGSGKFLTIYPSDERQFKVLIEDLYVATMGKDGAYILSNKRYKDSKCIYYRYGTMAPIYRTNILGKRIQTLRSPTGEEVEDVRHPYFTPPHWTSDPFPSVASEDDGVALTLNNGRFTIQKVFARSNSGGVYLAVDSTTSHSVVIKEARAFTEMHLDGTDAIYRLKHEGTLLSLVADTGVTPDVITSFYDWENFFLVEEYIDALNLRDFFLANRPVSLVNPDRRHVEIFYRDYRRVFVDILKAVQQLHAKGLVIGDISPKNILIEKTTGSVKLIDLESAYRVGIDDPSGIVTLGFNRIVKSTTGIREMAEDPNFEGDLYALGTMLAYGLYPIPTLAYIKDDFYGDTLKIIINDNGLGHSKLHEIINGLRSATLTCQQAIEMLSAPFELCSPYHSLVSIDRSHSKSAYEKLRDYLLDQARVERGIDKPLFPCDAFSFLTNHVSVGFGSAGVIHSLVACGVAIPSQLISHLRADLVSVEEECLAPGFLTGAAGIAMAAMSINEMGLARTFLSYANSNPLRFSSHSLYYGSAGIGLANLEAYLKTNEDFYLQETLRHAKHLSETAIEDSSSIYWVADSAIHIGLGYGQSGVALFFLRLSQVLGAKSWRELGLKALNYDLTFGREIEPGVTTFPRGPNEHRTFEPYLEEGSAGIAKVAIRYGLWDAVDKLLVDAHRKYSVFPGMIYGLSGFIDVFVDAYRYSGDERYLQMACRPLQGLHDLYLFKQDRGYATPGDGLIRISCDYATGVAGVMRAMHRLAYLGPSDFFLDDLDPSNVHCVDEKDLSMYTGCNHRNRHIEA